MERHGAAGDENDKRERTPRGERIVPSTSSRDPRPQMPPPGVHDSPGWWENSPGLSSGRNTGQVTGGSNHSDARPKGETSTAWSSLPTKYVPRVPPQAKAKGSAAVRIARGAGAREKSNTPAGPRSDTPPPSASSSSGLHRDVTGRSGSFDQSPGDERPTGSDRGSRPPSARPKVQTPTPEAKGSRKGEAKKQRVAPHQEHFCSHLLDDDAIRAVSFPAGYIDDVLLGADMSHFIQRGGKPVPEGFLEQQTANQQRGPQDPARMTWQDGRRPNKVFKSKEDPDVCDYLPDPVHDLPEICEFLLVAVYNVLTTAEPWDGKPSVESTSVTVLSSRVQALLWKHRVHKTVRDFY